MFAASVSTVLRRAAVAAPRRPAAAAASSLLLSLPSSSAASSSSSLPSLLSRLSLLPPPPTAAAGRRAFSTSPLLATPRPGLLKRKGLGRIPHLARTTRPRTHSGAKNRFKSYKNGTFKHVKAGTNQLKRKDNALKRSASTVMIFAGKAQTAKLKKLMPYWRRTRRNGGW